MASDKKEVVMTRTDRITQFRKRYLAIAIGFCTLPSAYAMQSLSDDALSDATGEGVAIILDDFKMVMQKPNDLSQASSYNRTLTGSNMPAPEQLDTGFIRIIPTGENYNLYYDRVHQGIVDKEYPGFYNNFYTRDYSTLYNQYYNLKYNEIYQNGSTSSSYYRDEYTNIEGKFKKQYTDYRISDLYNNSTEKFSITSSNPEGFFSRTDNWTFREYYEERKQQYVLSRVRQDNTVNHGNAYGDSDKAGQRAWLNTVEMIWRFKTADINAYVANRLHETTLSYLRITATNAAEEAGRKNAITDITQFAVDAATAVANRDALQTLKESRTKADIFIYGLALSSSEGNTDLNQRYSNRGLSWGTSSNPWLFRAGNEEVSQYYTGNTKQIGYIALEAPLAKNNVSANGTITKDTTDNNIKLGFWSDIFARPLDSIRDVDPITGAPKYNEVASDGAQALDVNYRLRTQFVANGLSLNGSQVRLFQTLGEKPELNGINAKPRSQEHFETLGIAALLRLNTNDNPKDLQYIKEEGLTGTALTTAQASNKTNLNGQAIRISTAEQSDDVANTPVTPALSLNGLAPLFNANEGLYLYSPNINLVLGQMNQPFVFGSEGNNIVLEVTRIPDVASIYHSIYQDYSNANAGKDLVFNNEVVGTAPVRLGMAAAQGSTCNVYSCGNEFVMPNAAAPQYQGRNATHSSITIGSVSYDHTKNALNAQRDNNSTGIVFKDRAGVGVNLGSVAIDGVLIQHLKIKTTGL